MKLTNIIIYPIKALGGIQLASSKMETQGLEHDRRMMLVTPDGQFISQRKFPKLSLLDCTLSPSHVVVSKRHDARQSIEIDPGNISDSMEVHVWNDSLLASKLAPEYSEFFSDYLGVHCELVAMNEQSNRATEIGHTQVSLADGYPILIIGEAALACLNDQLDDPVEMQRFRPNLVFSGGAPHDEDNWAAFEIGDARLKMTKPCARCMVPTIDPQTGEKGKEPIKTLQRYRLRDTSIHFGSNAIVTQTGNVNIGDEITLLPLQ